MPYRCRGPVCVSPDKTCQINLSIIGRSVNAVQVEHIRASGLRAAIESALRELGCGHISPEVTPYIHGNMNL